MAAFFKLRLLTAQRGAEVCAMRWRDVDLKSGWWTIPATVAKNKLAHRVPLSQTVQSLLKERRAIADQGQQTGIASAKEPREAVYALAGARGKRQQAVAAATFSVSDFRGHDLRRTAASFMASGGIPRLTVAKILNHVERTVTAVYDRHSYDAEKTAALTWWDAKLKAVLEQREAARNHDPQRTRSSRDRRRRRGEQSPNA
jgi:integrase